MTIEVSLQLRGMALGLNKSRRMDKARRCLPTGAPPPNFSFHLTAARLWFGLNPKSHGGEAAGDRPR